MRKKEKEKRKKDKSFLSIGKLLVNTARVTTLNHLNKNVPYRTLLFSVYELKRAGFVNRLF